MLIFFASLLFTLSLTYLIRPFLKKYYLAIPNKRSSHVFPTPTGGGITIAIVSSIILISKGYYFLIGLIPISYIGFIDDKKHVNSLLRFCIQIATSYFLIYKNIDNLKWILPDNIFLFFLIILFLIIFSATIINFINFMDGLDGLVSSCLIIAFSFISLFSINFYWVIVGSILGFIYFNWQPAKIFIGDVGTNFLSSMYLYALFFCGTFDAFFSNIFILFPIFLDPFITLIRRLRLKQNIFLAHKMHLYQRLSQNGWSHSKVSLLFMCSCLVLSFFYLAFDLQGLFFGCFIFVIVYFKLDKWFAKPLVIEDKITIL